VYYQRQHEDALEFCEDNDIDPSEELDSPKLFTVADIGTRGELDTVKA